MHLIFGQQVTRLRWSINLPKAKRAFKVIHALLCAFVFLIPLTLLIGVKQLEGQTIQSHSERLLRELNDTSSSYVFVAAHRGGWERDWENRAPENSIANIDKAFRMGFDVYETDLCQSKDGYFVIMHDERVDRTTNGTGRVKDLSLSKLKELNLKYTNGKLSNESVPTFEEFLRRGNGKILFKIDFRAPLETFPAAVRLVEENGMLGHVFFRFWWSNEIKETLSQFIESGMPFHPSLIMFRTQTPEQVRAAISNFNLNIIEVFLPPYDATKESQKITPEIQEALSIARKAGVLVETHSYGEKQEWQELIMAGFRMLHTQEPEAMNEFLRKYGVH